MGFTLLVADPGQTKSEYPQVQLTSELTPYAHKLAVTPSALWLRIDRKVSSIKTKAEYNCIYYETQS